MAKPTKAQRAMIERGVPLSVALRFPSYAALDEHIERRVTEAVEAKIRAHLKTIPNLTAEQEAATWASVAIVNAGRRDYGDNGWGGDNG